MTSHDSDHVRRSAATAGGRAQETDKDLGGKIEEGLGPHGLGIITIADVSSKRCGLTARVNRDFESWVESVPEPSGIVPQLWIELWISSYMTVLILVHAGT